MISTIVLIISLLLILLITVVIVRSIIKKQQIFGRPPIPVFFFHSRKNPGPRKPDISSPERVENKCL